jgi:hypothetical protein
MTLSSTTRFIIQASNTGRYAKLMGNGRSYRLPGRNIVTTDLSPQKSASKRSGNFGHKAGDAQSRPGSNANTLDGRMDNHQVHMELQLTDRNSFLLVSRGFHWVQEFPLGRF